MRLINLCSEKSRIYSERKKYFHLQSTTYFCHSATEFLTWKVTVMKQQTWQATFKEGWWISMKKYPKEEELNTKVTELALYNLFYILLAVVSVGCDRLQIKRIILFSVLSSTALLMWVIKLSIFNSKAGYVSGGKQWFLQIVCTSLIQDMISDLHLFENSRTREQTPNFTVTVVSFAITSNECKITRQDLTCRIPLASCQLKKVN